MRNSILGGLALLGAVALPGCLTPATDPNHGVSESSYRSAITRVQSNLTDRIIPAVAAVLSSDKTHDAAWKASKMGVLYDTVELTKATLKGNAP